MGLQIQITPHWLICNLELGEVTFEYLLFPEATTVADAVYDADFSYFELDMYYFGRNDYTSESQHFLLCSSLRVQFQIDSDVIFQRKMKGQQE